MNVIDSLLPSRTLGYEVGKLKKMCFSCLNIYIVMAMSQTRGYSVRQPVFPFLETPNEYDIIQNKLSSTLHIAAQKKITNFLNVKGLKIKD